MHRRLLSLATLSFLGLAVTGATCSSETRGDSTDDGGTVIPGAPPAPMPVTQMKTNPDELPLPTAEDLPGVPLDQMVGQLARQIFALAKDAFSYDGCPTDLQGCLKDPRYRRHARRVLELALRLAADGQSNVEINALLNHYYASFAATERVKVGESIAPCRGSAEAPVVLAVFSDFECPHCNAARPLLDEILAGGRSQVRLCYKPFPLPSHSHARDAAEAALFARDQGKFWEMHDTLFDHQTALTLADMRSYASDLGLDPNALQVAVLSNAHAVEIDASRTLGERAHLTGTPSIFVNGRPLILPLTRDNLIHAIDDELDFQANHGHFAPDGS